MITFGFIVCGILYVVANVAIIKGMMLEGDMWKRRIEQREHEEWGRNMGIEQCKPILLDEGNNDR